MKTIDLMLDHLILYYYLMVHSLSDILVFYQMLTQEMVEYLHSDSSLFLQNTSERDYEPNSEKRTKQQPE